MFHKNIKIKRKERGLTLQKLADQVNSSKSYIWEIENNHRTPTIFLCNRIAKALEVSLDDLVNKDFSPQKDRKWFDSIEDDGKQSLTETGSG